MLRKLLPLLIPVMTLAQTVDLSGRILSKDLAPISGAIVELKEQGLSDTTDSNGNYEIKGNLTSTITPQEKEKHVVSVKGQNITLNLENASSVQIDLFTMQGRKVTETTSRNLKSGSHTLTPFKNRNLASGFYILKVQTDDLLFTSKYVIADNSMVSSLSEKVLANSTTPTSRNSYSLEVTKSGQKVLDIPVSSLVEKLPDYLLVQRNIAGKLSGDCSAVGKIEFSLFGPSVSDTILKEVWFNSAISGYSGFLFMQHSEDEQEFNLAISVYDTLGHLTGRSATITFNHLAGDIQIPDFNPLNGVITQSIEGPASAIVGTTLEFTRTVSIPFGEAKTFRWDDMQSAGWDDSLTEDLPFQVAYNETGVFQVRSQVIDDKGRTSTVEKTITIIDSIQKWDSTGAAPITLEELDSLIKTPHFYNADYRPAVADGLGTRYNALSAGLFDTWKGETQLQIVLPTDSFKINGEFLKFSTEFTPDYVYWEALALMQELFSIDMQVAMSMGAKESYAGLNRDNSGLLNQSWGKGPFGMERQTISIYGKGYPKFYSTISNLESISVDAFETFHHGHTFTMNSSYMPNAIFAFSVILSTHYDILHHATDIYWDEILPEAVDSRLGTATLLSMYHQGPNGCLSQWAENLAKDTWEETAQKTDILQEPVFNNGSYISSHFETLTHLTSASKNSLTDLTLPIIDTQISKAQLLKLFFGNGGTKVSLGAGGILQHIPLTKEELAEAFNTLEAAFEIVKGKAPTTTGTETISLRYDLLSVTRTVKHLLDTKREKTTSSEALNVINTYSKGE